MRTAGLADLVVVGHQTNHLMPDNETLWRASLGGMAVTASAIAAQDETTQARARDVVARRAEVYKIPEGLDSPISFLVGSGQKR
jgi:hypothetical protein